MQFNSPGKQAGEEQQLGVLVTSGGAPRWFQTPASRITRKTSQKKKGGGEVEFRTDRLLWFPAQRLVELRRLQNHFHSYKEDAALHLMLVATATNNILVK